MNAVSSWAAPFNEADGVANGSENSFAGDKATASGAEGQMQRSGPPSHKVWTAYLHPGNGIENAGNPVHELMCVLVKLATAEVRASA